MKVLTVYPSAVMRISCPNCRVEGTIRRESPPTQDFPIRCPRCKERFLVKVNLRKFYRKEVSLPIQYSLVDESGFVRKAREGMIVDISREGLCIESYRSAFSPEEHKEGNLFHLTFSLPPRESVLKVQGVVTRIIRTEGKNTFKVGIRFRDLDEFSSKQIGFFLWP